MAGVDTDDLLYHDIRADALRAERDEALAEADRLRQNLRLLLDPVHAAQPDGAAPDVRQPGEAGFAAWSGKVRCTFCLGPAVAFWASGVLAFGLCRPCGVRALSRFLAETLIGAEARDQGDVVEALQRGLWDFKTLFWHRAAEALTDEADRHRALGLSLGDE